MIDKESLSSRILQRQSLKLEILESTFIVCYLLYIWHVSMSY